MLDAERSLELLDRVGEGILALDADGRVTYLNRTAEQFVFALFGVSPVQLLHQELWTALPQLVGTRLETEVRRFATVPGEVEFEEPFPPLGRWFAVRIATTDAGMLLTLRDVTDRKVAQDALGRWARIFEHAGWGVAILSGDGLTIEAVNQAFAQMHGWEVAELAGRPVSVLWVADRRADQAMERIVRNRGHHIWESEHRRRDGSAFPVLIDTTLVQDDDGRMVYRAVNVQDLTERKRAEEQVRQAQKMEAVGRLAGGVAHDFNNMMMIILGFSDFLLTALAAEDPRRADAEEIRKAADRAQQLARQLLSFGRQQLVAREVLSLNAVIAGLERMLRPLLGENVGLVAHLAAEPGAVEADHGQLEQVLMNLALNARDAMRASGGQLVIETIDVMLPEGYGYEQVGIEIPAGPYVVLRVSDTGHGMTPEVKARLFEPFFTTKSADRNTGLGLASVYGIVVQSGGYIWVDSEAGRGSVFTICLPRASDAEVQVDEPDPPSALPGGSETILLVEDEEAVRGFARRVLVTQGYTVIEAANGRDALSLVPAHAPFDLVLTDVVMPEVGGQELVAQLLRDRPALRVVYMSGYSEADKLLPAILDPAYSFLRKPFSVESLALTIREALDRRLSLPA